MSKINISDLKSIVKFAKAIKASKDDFYFVFNPNSITFKLMYRTVQIKTEIGKVNPFLLNYEQVEAIIKAYKKECNFTLEDRQFKSELINFEVRDLGTIVNLEYAVVGNIDGQEFVKNAKVAGKCPGASIQEFTDFLYLELRKENSVLVATDRYRISEAKLNAECLVEYNVTLHYKSLETLLPLIEGNVSILTNGIATDKFIYLDTHDIMYPNYKNVIPQLDQFDFSFGADPNLLIPALKKHLEYVKTDKTKKTNLDLYVKFWANKLELKTITQFGELVTLIELELPEQLIEISVNNQYLLDALESFNAPITWHVRKDKPSLFTGDNTTILLSLLKK